MHAHPPFGLALLTVVLTWLVSFGLAAEEDAYPRAELLVEPAHLAKPEFAKRVVVLDARERAKYDAGHVPGARWVDHAAWSKGFGQGQDAEAWSKRITQLGVESKSTVVVYDDSSFKNAARIWWILKYWGVEDARVVNGGWKGWESGQYPAEKTEPPAAATEFLARPQAARLLLKAQVLSAFSTGKLQIIDARSEQEHCGIDQPKTSRAGAIPGAKHLEWSDLVEQPTQRFKSPAELRRLLKQAGIRLDQATATHCASGGRASVMALGLELMGAKQVGDYYAGWLEWSTDDKTPIVPGKPKSPDTRNSK